MKTPKFPDISPADWDFRGVSDWEIELAYEHEIQREVRNPSEPSGPPWTTVDPQSRKEFADSEKKWAPGPIWVVPAGKTHESYPTRLLIEIRPLGHSKEEILEAVEKAIDEGNLRDSMGRRGMGGRRPRVELLRRLSAFRFMKAGFTFDQAQTFLMKERTDQKISGWPVAWPNYATPSTWSKAIKLARHDVRAAQDASDQEHAWIASPDGPGSNLS